MVASEIYKEYMQKCQLLTGNVRQTAVLAALHEVNRAGFVPDKFRASAYVDDEIPLAGGRFLMAPVEHARLLEFAEIREDDKVLDIGCGMGYTAAVLAEMAGRVVAVENIPELVNRARQALNGYKNVEVITAPLVSGYGAYKPYSLIMVEGAVEDVPEVLLNQLEDGGRLVTVKIISRRPDSLSGLGKACRITRRGEQFETFMDFDISVPLIPSFSHKKTFTF